MGPCKLKLNEKFNFRMKYVYESLYKMLIVLGLLDR